jgi:6-pyruvoyl-tetrahydropterin synthase
MKDVLITEYRKFAADHYHSLPDFCEPRHGHNWEIEASVISNEHSSRLASLLDDWIAGIDNTLLNEQAILAERNPTAETLAEWVFKYLETSGLCPVIVRIKEKLHYWATCIKY